VVVDLIVDGAVDMSATFVVHIDDSTDRTSKTMVALKSTAPSMTKSTTTRAQRLLV
jgi:hypothetical protein